MRHLPNSGIFHDAIAYLCKCNRFEFHDDNDSTYSGSITDRQQYINVHFFPRKKVKNATFEKKKSYNYCHSGKIFIMENWIVAVG